MSGGRKQTVGRKRTLIAIIQKLLYRKGLQHQLSAILYRCKSTLAGNACNECIVRRQPPVIGFCSRRTWRTEQAMPLCSAVSDLGCVRPSIEAGKLHSSHSSQFVPLVSSDRGAWDRGIDFTARHRFKLVACPYPMPTPFSDGARRAKLAMAVYPPRIRL
jgi:hypothetical protein